MHKASSIAEYLAENETLTYTNVGVSMLPLLRQGKDLFILRRKGPGRCKKGDVALYRRGNQYVLHRIVEVRPADYVALGDNCVTKETGIQDSAIIGVMTGFVRNGKEHSVREWGYRLYSHFILHTMGPRIILKKIRIRAKGWLHEK